MEEALLFFEKVALREALGATALAFALGEVLRTLGAVFLLGGVGLGAGERELAAEGRREIAILMSFFPPLRLGFIVADRKPVAPAFAIGSFTLGQSILAGSAVSGLTAFANTGLA